MSTRTFSISNIFAFSILCGLFFVPSFAFARTTVNVVTTAIRCDSEAYLPNWGSPKVTDITSSTASDFLATHPHCHLDSGWSYQWWIGGGIIPDADLNASGVSPNAGMTQSVATGLSGQISASLSYEDWEYPAFGFRQVPQVGDLPMSHIFGVSDYSSQSALSAEFYCAGDAANYDNLEFVGGMVDGGIYYCVAFNTLNTANLDVYSVADGVWVPTDSANPLSVLSFGSVDQSSGEQTRDFQVKNIGALDLGYQVNLPGGAVSPYYTCTGSCTGAGIAPGGTQNFTIHFNPNPTGATTGSKNASVTITNTSGYPGGTTPITMNFTATVIDNQAMLDVVSSPSNVTPIVVTGDTVSGFSADFGNVSVGASITRQLYLYNAGAAASSLTLSYPALTAPSFASALSGAISPLAQGAYTPLSVTFTPTSAGAKTQTLTVTTNGCLSPCTSVNITMQGNAVAVPDLSVTPEGQSTYPFSTAPRSANLTFTDQEVASGASSALTITVTNAGGGASSVSASSNNTAFVVTPASGAVSASGGTRVFSITFDPSAVQSYSGTITLTSPDYVDPFVVYVNGNGILAPSNLLVSPSPLAFGNVTLGKTREYAVTIHSIDSHALDFDAPNTSIVGAGFTCVSANCADPFTLNNGEEKVFTVRFTPTAKQSYAGTFTFNITTPGFTNPVINLSGRGVKLTLRFISE